MHCGFCNATCPTYQLLGDELDGPRGRIYLIKQMLEGQAVTPKTQLHLDRCLTCVNCQTTCPSGVSYGKLLEIGREIAEERIPRPLLQRMIRRALRLVLPYTQRFNTVLTLGQLVRPVLPAALKQKVPLRNATRNNHPLPQQQHARKMLILDGCVQPVLDPATNIATTRVLDRLGISVVQTPDAGCCGALSQHLNAGAEAQTFMKANIDAWWPHIEAGAEAIIMTASGCGSLVKAYGDYLKDDPDYADKAARVSALTKDLSEVLSQEDLGSLAAHPSRRIAFHPPCTLQHEQKLQNVVEQILIRAGFELLPVEDAHLCCGSAGTYSILQHELSQKLLTNKLHNLQQQRPELIATANIGCLSHLQSRAKVPVAHWIHLFDNQ